MENAFGMFPGFEPDEWSNDACRGYVIMAMEDCGFSKKDIRRVVGQLSFPSFYGTLFTHRPTWNCTSFSRARARRLSMTLPILPEQTAAIFIRGGM